MRIPGPYSDDTWQWLPDGGETGGIMQQASKDNSPVHVLWELGMVLLVPLAGAGVVALALDLLRIY